MKVKKIIKALRLVKVMCFEGECCSCPFKVNENCTLKATPNAWTIGQYGSIVEENLKKKGYE